MVPDLPARWKLDPSFDLHIEDWRRRSKVPGRIVSRVRRWVDRLQDDPIGNATPEPGNDETDPWMNVYSATITDAEEYGPIHCIWQVEITTQTIRCLDIRTGTG